MNKYIFLMLCLQLFCSCTDWLDVEPRDKMQEKKQFASESAINSALNGLYRTMISPELYGGNLTQTTIEHWAHQYYYSTTTTSGGETTIYREMSNFNYDDISVKGAIAKIWDNSYQLVFRINNFIKGLEESDAILSADHRNWMLGEAYGLRAYVLFDMFRLFGPLYDETTANSIAIPYANQAEAVAYPNDTARVFVSKLLDDIATAEALLQNDPVIRDAASISEKPTDDFYANRNRRMNYYAVKALNARILFYAGQDRAAADTAKVIINRAVGNGKRFHWTTVAQGAGRLDYTRFHEVIFGVNNLDMYSKANTWYLGTSRFTGYYVERAHLNEIYMTGENNVRTEDTRYAQWTSSRASSSEVDLCVSLRYSTYPESVSAVQNLQPLIRIAELYYIVGEVGAKHPEWNIGEVTLLNELLQARAIQINHRLPDNADRETIMELLDKEYYREFIGEGQTFFYNKRQRKTEIISCSGADFETVNRTPEKIYVLPLPESETNI
jgi:hypothetical protein